MPLRIVKALLFCFVLLSGPSVFSSSELAHHATKVVPVINISGAIGPAVGDYVIEEITLANQTPNISALVLTIDTPGGLVSSLREINQSILASKVPILCLVYPQGARAASAGTFILYACHIAAMAPATTLGAATPVSIGGASPEKSDEAPNEPSAMEKKMLNDSIAYIRSLAQLRGRNAEWAEKAVREAATLSSSEALEQNVINLIADTPEQLLIQSDGLIVSLNDTNSPLETAEAKVEYKTPDWRHQFLSTITDPNIAYILMMIGIYGLLLEFYSPGFGVAGVVGAICLLIATYAFQMLPVNYVGMGLILLGIGLLVAESLIPSFGILGFGGVIAFVLGSIFLIESDLPELQVSLNLIYSIAVLSAAFVVFVLRRVLLLRQSQVVSGVEYLIGQQAVVENSFTAEGYVHIAGERWAAHGDDSFIRGEIVVVEAIDGLSLKIRKQQGGRYDGADNH
ncbi:nodulation protein NfeD [Vibrio tubiashii]|uniref:NfeD family protein n=1 Tax=Vibrio tubiashii TaxID=29498 RepID=UPI001EFE2ED2|nr:nodulation protein NfeD [Vibrio tubiashii]MCG9581166.1 nodulation protein NfeD [Vibrio tubiashii]MCG9614757.1 nodulation protein NfeD [Vibrio tubiashii]MCG9689207.1 nodulation protein NfeD [Vibrio tubiashii]